MAKQTHGTALLTCRNHPTLRWVQTKYVLEGRPSPYMGRGCLMFRGQVGGKPAHPFAVLGESAVSAAPEQWAADYRANYQPECDCPGSELEFLSWVNEEEVAAA